MKQLVKIIKEKELKKLAEFLESNPAKKVVLKNLKNEINQLNKDLSRIKEPVKNYSSLDRFLLNNKYKKYQREYNEYILKKANIESKIVECNTKIIDIDKDLTYDSERQRVTDLIPLIEQSKNISEIALYTFYGTLDIKSSLKYLMAVILLIESLDIIKTDESIDKVYDGLELDIINKKLNDVNLESFVKNLKKIKIDIDDGFYQFIMMILSEESLCTEKNLMNCFPILKQLKKDKEVPKNIRVAIDIIESNYQNSKTIHEVGCEIFLKEIFYKIKGNC